MKSNLLVFGIFFILIKKKEFMDNKSTPLEFNEMQRLALTPVTQKPVLLINNFPESRRCDEEQNVNNRISASELFSHFTADVIKEEVVFTR